MKLYMLILLLKKKLPLDYSFKKEYNISMVALDHLLSQFITHNFILSSVGTRRYPTPQVLTDE